jgi:hypothetical protein
MAAAEPRIGLEQPFNFGAWSGVAWGFVLADVAKTAAEIHKLSGAKRWLKDVCGMVIDLEGRYFTPFRIKGNLWTNLVGNLDPSTAPSVSPQLLLDVSTKLKTKTIFATYQDTAGVFFYVLFDKGQVSEMLYSDGSQKLKVLSSVNGFIGAPDQEPPGRFIFFSSLRELKRGELKQSNITSFFDAFLRDQGAFLVLETGNHSNGTFTFTPHRVKASSLERADFIGALDEAEVKVERSNRDFVHRVAEEIESCNLNYFYAFKARDEYKSMPSRRPTLSQCREHEALYRKTLCTLGELLESEVEPNDRWLRRTVRNGNLELVKLMLEREMFSSKPDLLAEAINDAIELGQSEIAECIKAAGKKPRP